jgi:hypothetical protein
MKTNYKKEIFEIIEKAHPKYIDILEKVENILRNEQLYGQANVVMDIAEWLAKKEYEKFIKQINSIGMWGGSGAVWEVYIENSDNNRRFQSEIIELINLMEKTKILGRGIKPLRKLFQKDLTR